MRVAAQLDQNTLAALAGVDQSSISHWERGTTRPAPASYAKLLVILPQLQMPPTTKDTEDTAA